ncbi:Protein FAR1-RELATED SEQUENCE 11 [Abeliophyllum distichum]|uniref:Protein FAR1-RELATED SEQUENCE 11 n=1 Tax=Abeliophyllum distichum TaxID=126358 RepID=A0ABD1VVY5_9LAMI
MIPCAAIGATESRAIWSHRNPPIFGPYAHDNPVPPFSARSSNQFFLIFADDVNCNIAASAYWFILVGVMPEITSIMKETSANGSESSPDDDGTDAAYEFYCSFAKQCGFSIRRHRTRGKDGVGKGITRRDFTCHRGGFPQLKPSEDGKLQRNRKSSRCGCQAYMRIVKRANFDVPEWRVTGFSNVHNHDLLKFNEARTTSCPQHNDC